MLDPGNNRNEYLGQVFSRAPTQKSEAASEPQDPAELEKDARIRRLARPYWIGYTRAIEIRNRIERLLDMPYSDRITSCAIISPSYNGKTSILRHIQRRHNILPPLEQLGSSRQDIKIPVFFLQAPPVPDEDRLLEALLRKLQVQGSPRESPERKLSRIQAVFAGLGVKLLALDEFGFYQAVGPERQRRALNALKYISNDLKIPIVLASVEAGLSILTTNSELSNRFPAEQLPLWNAEAKETLQLLSSLETKLGLRHPSNLGTEGMARLVVANTGGTFGHMHELLCALAENAIRTGAERITMADLMPEGLAQIRWIHPAQRHQRQVMAST